METVFEVETHQIDLARIVEDVFSTMLGMGAVLSAAADAPEECLTASVQFVGEWRGVVLLTCGAQLARRFTARLMQASSGAGEAASKDDISDTLGEVVNMIGGNLKSVLPVGVVLSIPSVIEGRDFALRICGGNEFKTNHFLCEDGAFEITLVRVVG